MRLHVKALRSLSVLNALLTRTLPKFLSGLNEMSGGRENISLASGSLRRILEFLGRKFFAGKVLWMKGEDG